MTSVLGRTGEHPMTSVADLIAQNPYPGLRPFDTSDADRFFGRTQQIAELVTRLDEVPFVAVAGTSGCGKSSLVRAGLLNVLARTQSQSQTQTHEGRPVWRSAVMRPGNRPIANLAACLQPLVLPAEPATPACINALYGRLSLGGLSLADEVSRTIDSTVARLLIVVDQFEEIFRYQRMSSADEASAFVKLLLNAAADPAAAISVVVTMRSETLGLCADFRDLPEAINRGLYLVPKLTREQRKDAIVKPAELRGATVAPRLVQRVLNDVTDSFDDLPVMQHVLARTWRRWTEACRGTRAIDLEDYEHPTVGTAAKAISTHADEALGSLDNLSAVARKVFCALTERAIDGATVSDVRRPLEFQRLCAVTGEPDDSVAAVVDRYRQPDTAFLMPQPGTALASNPVIDISHESLMRQWKSLQGWMTEEAGARSTLVKLVDAATAYDAQSGSLWRGKDLQRVIEWVRRMKPTVAWVELQLGRPAEDVWLLCGSFIRRATLASRARLVAFATVVAIVAVLSGVALRLEAVRQRATRSRELANRALLLTSREPAKSAHLARAALDAEATPAAEYALREALINLEPAHTERVFDLQSPIQDLRYSAIGNRLLAASGNLVHLFDGRTFDRVGTALDFQAPVIEAWLVANETAVVVRLDTQGQIRSLSGTSSTDLACDRDGDDSVFSMAMSPDQRLVAVGCRNGDVRLWDAVAGGPPRDLVIGADKGATVTALAFSADNAYLASGDAAGAVTVWKTDRSEPWIGKGVRRAKQSPIAHADAIRSLSFHPTDPELLATGGDDGVASIWTLDVVGRRVRLDSKTTRNVWHLQHDRPVMLVRFAPRADSGGQLITVTDKVVRIWVNEVFDPRQMHAHDDWVNDVSATADGELLLSASSDGSARLWSTRASTTALAVLRGHRDDVTKVVASPDGSSVVTASSDHTIRVWRIHPPRRVWSSAKWVISAAFNRTGTSIAIGEDDLSGVLDLRAKVQDPVTAFTPLPSDSETDMFAYLTWSHDGRFISGLRSSYRLNTATGPSIWDVGAHKDVTPEWLRRDHWRASFSAGTDDFIAVDRHGRIAVWNSAALTTAGDAPAPVIAPFGSGYTAAAISPDGRWIAATGGGNQSISLWRRDQTQSEPRRMTGHDGAVRTLEFSRDSRWLITASMDHTARIWSVEQAEQWMNLAGSPSPLADAAFDSSGTKVATAGADGTVRVYDTRTGVELGALRWHSEGVNDVEFGPDDRTILSASDDGNVTMGECQVCDLTVAQLRTRVDEHATLTEVERRELERDVAGGDTSNWWARLSRLF